jgi:hypothetical protein
MTQGNVLNTPFFREISTSCQDVWRHRAACDAPPLIAVNEFVETGKVIS